MTDISKTLEARNELYGDFGGQADIADAIKEIMRSSRNWSKLKPFQREAVDMFAVKESRILNGDPDCFDSWHDIEGYARLVASRLPR